MIIQPQHQQQSPSRKSPPNPNGNGDILTLLQRTTRSRQRRRNRNRTLMMMTPSRSNNNNNNDTLANSDSDKIMTWRKSRMSSRNCSRLLRRQQRPNRRSSSSSSSNRSTNPLDIIHRSFMITTSLIVISSCCCCIVSNMILLRPVVFSVAAYSQSTPQPSMNNHNNNNVNYNNNNRRTYGRNSNVIATENDINKNYNSPNMAMNDKFLTNNNRQPLPDSASDSNGNNHFFFSSQIGNAGTPSNTRNGVGTTTTSNTNGDVLSQAEQQTNTSPITTVNGYTSSLSSSNGHIVDTSRRNGIVTAAATTTITMDATEIDLNNTMTPVTILLSEDDANSVNDDNKNNNNRRPKRFNGTSPVNMDDDTAMNRASSLDTEEQDNDITTLSAATAPSVVKTPWYKRPYRWLFPRKSPKINNHRKKEDNSNVVRINGVSNETLVDSIDDDDSTAITGSSNNEDYDDDDDDDTKSLRRSWRRRHARTLEEGIRFERRRTNELSQILDKAQIDARQGQERTYVERTLMGLLNALAEEIEDLDIDLNTVPKTPLWRKEIEEIRINFSRLGFRPIRMGGVNATTVPVVNTDSNETYALVVDNNQTLDTDSTGSNLIEPLDKLDDSVDTESAQNETTIKLALVESADEAFDRIDEDNSGTLDRDEIAQALSSISALQTDRESIEELASNLVDLYDINGDGVVDREEYQRMVEDMAKIRPAKDNDDPKNDEKNPFDVVKDSLQSVSEGISKKAVEVASAARERILKDESQDTEVEETEMGSIVLSNMSVDLRRILFGAVPVVKKLSPGGPLILRPFTATVTASFSREDVMGSFLLDAGLRRLVARALRVRVRAFRDGVDGALFFGRRWKMTSKTAPVVDVLGLSNVEFDSRDRMIITGRARIRTSPDAPIVTQTFKLRAKIGTRKNGQVIRLVEPELAFVFECPPAIESGLALVCESFGLAPPERPEPYYSFFPIYSPFKVSDNDGFDMGEDNCLRSIYIRNGKLRFEMSAVLRPGRFLGSHYLAFTVPQRTFIITMDRVWEGIRAARENKRIAARAKKLKERETATGRSIESYENGENDLSSLELNTSPLENTSNSRSQPNKAKPQSESPSSRLFRAIRNNKPKPKSFFARFVEGYTLIEREGEANNDRLTNEISDWFGRQGRSNTTASSSIAATPFDPNITTTNV